MRLELPQDYADFGIFASGDLEDPDLAGTGDLPPVIDDEDQAAKVLFWLRTFRLNGSALPRMAWVGINVTDAVQTRTARPEFVGVGDGQPDQQYALVNGQVVTGTLILEVEGPDGWRPWTEVDGFHASGEDDTHYLLDAESGEVRFGRVVQGRAPQIGERIRATTYRYGGGQTGNVAAGAISKIVGVSGVKVLNPLSARGGEDEEPIEDALARIPGELQRRDRAVTEGDFRELARATPGASVGRAEVLPLFHPRNPDVEAAGAVTVVVWPKEDAAHPDAPQPDRTLLRAVCAWLDARRLVTTELHVVPPTYRQIAVSVGVEAKPGYGIDAVRRWVELVVRQYLAPLPPYGPGGEGWPLGRRVHGPELEAAALQVEGVEYIHRRTDAVGQCGLEVAGYDEATSEWIEGSIELQPFEVPHLVRITVVSGEPRAVGEDLVPPASPKVPIPVPTLGEDC